MSWTGSRMLEALPRGWCVEMSFWSPARRYVISTPGNEGPFDLRSRGSSILPAKGGAEEA